jgi:hypothetical protein
MKIHRVIVPRRDVEPRGLRRSRFMRRDEDPDRPMFCLGGAGAGY